MFFDDLKNHISFSYLLWNMFVLTTSMDTYKMINKKLENDGKTIKEKVKNVGQNFAAKIKKSLYTSYQTVRVIRD